MISYHITESIAGSGPHRRSVHQDADDVVAGTRRDRVSLAAVVIDGSIAGRRHGAVKNSGSRDGVSIDRKRG